MKKALLSEGQLCPNPERGWVYSLSGLSKNDRMPATTSSKATRVTSRLARKPKLGVVTTTYKTPNPTRMSKMPIFYLLFYSPYPGEYLILARPILSVSFLTDS
jgi:hypothetical protein